MQDFPSTEELLDMLEEQDQKIEEQQAELEQLNSQNQRSEQQIQTLSSEKQELLSMLQAQSEKLQEQMGIMQEQKKQIAEQGERLVKQNESDLVLLQNEKLKEENQKLAEEAQRWKAAESQRMRLEQENAELKRSQSNVLSLQEKTKRDAEELQQQNERLKQENGKLRQNAEEAGHDCEKCGKLTFEQIKGKILQEKLAKLSGEKKAAQIAVQELEEEIGRYDMALLCMAIYGGIATIIAAIHSEAFISDFKGFFAAIGTFIAFLGKNVLKAANMASGLGNLIPQRIVGTAVRWILFGAVFVVVALALAATAYGIYRLGKAYMEYYGDNISLAALIGSLVIVIFLAEPISRILPAINLLVLCMILYGYYIGGRCAYNYGEYLGRKAA